MARFIKSFQNDAAIQAAVDDKSLGHPYVALDDQLHRIDWNGKEIDPAYEYFTVEAMSSGNFVFRGDGFYASKNGGEWVQKNRTATVSMTPGDKLRIKHTDSIQVNAFSGNTIQFNLSGNIESLEYGDDFIGKTASTITFGYLFNGSSGLLDASKLVLSAKKIYSYRGLFQGCTNLVTTPVFCANEITGEGYRNMFSGCTRITRVEIPNFTATKRDVLNDMFKGCSSLVYIKCLYSNPSSLSPANGWVSGVAETGTFVKKAGVTWPTGVNGIPSGWTVIEE